MIVPVPTEATSGFICPSDEGPKLEKLEGVPEVVTPPTAITLSPSAGEIIKCHEFVPSLPAEFTTRIPFLAARSAPTEVIAVFPFISAYVWLVFSKGASKVLYPSDEEIRSPPT